MASPSTRGSIPRYAGLPDRVMFGRLFEDHGRPLDFATADRLVRERIGRCRAAVSDHHLVARDTVGFAHALAARVPWASPRARFGRRSCMSWSSPAWLAWYL
jgi:hypothetical protein